MVSLVAALVLSEAVDKRAVETLVFFVFEEATVEKMGALPHRPMRRDWLRDPQAIHFL